MGAVDKHDQMPACFPIIRKFLQEPQDILSYDGHCPFQHNHNPLQTDERKV